MEQWVVTQVSGLVSKYWALKTILYSQARKRKTSFYVSSMLRPYLTETRGILTSFQVQKLSLSACACIVPSRTGCWTWLEVLSIIKVENTKCHFSGQKYVWDMHVDFLHVGGSRSWVCRGWGMETSRQAWFVSYFLCMYVKEAAL